ncbi:MAG: electron transfer flavoprotein subunit alpha/FixB family protein [Sphingobacterium sp.]
MSVLVYIENIEGTFKKSGFEAVSYAKTIAGLLGEEVNALSIGAVPPAELEKLAQYGADKVIKIENDQLKQFINQAYAQLIANVAKSTGAKTIILSNTFNGKGLAPRIAVKLDAVLCDGAINIPAIAGDVWTIKKSVFSSKAIATEELKAAVKVIALTPNSVETKEAPVPAQIETFQSELLSNDLATTIQEIVRATDKVSLPDATIVVSAGRGMKGPENWRIIEELADVLGAATACSKPVSDAGWRPHAEHVGQTGLAVSPNLYIAMGISGAIQHLAGVSSSKTIVVINKDPDAPFFKVADYGIVGDAFEIVPKLTEAIKAFKN